MNESNLQRNHFNKISDNYNYHYSDPMTQKYRHEIYYKKLFKNEDMNNKDILDVGCGTGELSSYLKERFPDAKIYGVDISDENINTYNKNFTGYRLNIVEGQLKDKKFDYIIASGLLHHVYKNLDKVLKNINGMLKSGGNFIFIDPNSSYILEPLRKIWYKLDDTFDDKNESALNYNSLINLNSKLTIGFEEKQIFYFGGPGFFLINNSMVFRLNKKIKSFLFKPLLSIDKIFLFFPKFFLASFCAIWTKR